ncbi:hypothetical protein [Paracoccus sp. (in: a-proteobacteria)]|uniref:hypothetical protein n=1 Tax=Paracoccus sp. TaxID=267 RepID=UPI00289F9FFD|nr:hypothetical protein [Paracoccus sp. (in: a-proteobacteria)]
MPEKHEYQLGQKAVDTVTGFTGTIVGHVVYLHGDAQYLIQPASPGPEFHEAQWISAKRLILVSEKAS